MQNFKSLAAENHIACLRSAIQKRQTVLIVGNTGSGKTLLLNAMAEEAATLFPDEQIAVFRDLPEGIGTDRANLTCHTGVRRLTPELRQSSTGLFVDEFFNELRADEALSFINALNTGHCGTICTYGASSEEGFRRIQSLVDSSKATDCIDVVVLMERTAKGPQVKDVQTTAKASPPSTPKPVRKKKPATTAQAVVLSDVGPSWCKFLPNVERWATELAALARADMQGQISASVWPYRINGNNGDAYLSVDMAGADGGDLCITFGVADGKSTEYDFDNLAGNTCFIVPDLTEAFCMTSALLEKLDATVTLPTRR